MVPVPRVVAPSLKVTVPLGKAPVKVARKVTVWAIAAGLGVTFSKVVLVAMLTVCANAAEVLVALFASPLYTAVRLCAPTVTKVALKVARPAVRGLLLVDY